MAEKKNWTKPKSDEQLASDEAREILDAYVEKCNELKLGKKLIVNFAIDNPMEGPMTIKSFQVIKVITNDVAKEG